VVSNGNFSRTTTFCTSLIFPANRGEKGEPTSGLEPLTYPHYE
jgi:hypothetical protein